MKCYKKKTSKNKGERNQEIKWKPNHRIINKDVQFLRIKELKKTLDQINKVDISFK